MYVHGKIQEITIDLRILFEQLSHALWAHNNSMRTDYHVSHIYKEGDRI